MTVLSHPETGKPVAPGTNTLRELATLGPPAAILALMLALAARGDAYPGELIRAVAAVLVFHVVPGALLWRAVRPVRGWLVEDLAMGLAIGAALAVPTQVLTVATGIGLLPVVVPLIVSATLLGVPALRERISSREVDSVPWWWGPAIAVVLVPGVLEYYVGVITLVVRWTGFADRYVDLPFHEGLVGEFLHRFPPHYPHVSGEPIAYHWFGHAWSADIVALSGTPIDVTLWRVAPALIHVTAPVITAAVAMRVTRAAWAGPVAALFGFVATSLQTWALTQPASPFTMASPTQEFGVLVLAGLLGVVVLRWRDELGRGGLLLMAFLMVIATGSKGTTLAVLIPGLALALVACALFRRERLRQVGTDLGLAIAIMVVMRLTVFDGGGEALEIDPFASIVTRGADSLHAGDVATYSATGMSLVLLSMVKAGLVAIGIAGALLARSGRRDPVLWLMLGGVVAGYGATVVFEHPGDAQLYFYKTAFVPLGIGVAAGVGVLVRASRGPARAAAVGVVTGVAGIVLAVSAPAVGGASQVLDAWVSVAALLATAATGGALVARRGGLASGGVAVTAAVLAAAVVPAVTATASFDEPRPPVSARPNSATSIAASDVRAYRWLRDHSSPDDLVATNQHCAGRTTPDCSRRAFSISAYTERRVLIEGWAYVPRASEQYDPEKGITSTVMPYWKPDLLALNDRFFARPDEASRTALQDLGVRWLVVVKRAPSADTLEPWATLRHSSRRVDVYELAPAAG